MPWPPSSCSPSPMLGTPERDSSPTPFQSQANSITLPDNVLHLQEEINKAMVHLLTVRALVDTHQQRIISEMEVIHCQNEIKTSEAIRKVQAHYAATLGNAKSTYGSAMRKAEATHSASTSEAEDNHTTAIRKAEAASAVQASKLQQVHQETMWNLEDEALEVEKHACQSFLQACGVALQACPNEALEKLMYPIHLLTGNMSLPGLLTATLPVTIKSRDPIPSPCCPRRSTTTTHSPRLSNNTCLDVRHNQIIQENLPYESRERKILWQNTWGVPIGRPSSRFHTWFSI